MPQYALPLYLAPLWTEDNFFVSDSNRDAHRWIGLWPNWPSHGLILYGESGCGKSHLGHVWATKNAAVILDNVIPNASGHLLLENIERIQDERALLHLINQCKENAHSLLLTSRAAPRLLPFTLPDLTSRLLALPSVAIAAPDDALLAAALRKQFSDRQLKVEEDLIAYLLPRIERSFSYVHDIVLHLDRHALQEHKNITIAFAKRTLGI